MSAKKALHSYLSKQLVNNNSRAPRKKYKKPEKIVEKLVLEWCKKHQLDVSVVECKGVFNSKTNTFLHGMTEPGYTDLSGNNRYGQALYIELKAKDRCSTLRQRQREFIVRKINGNCFACVVDSPKRLEMIYSEWMNLFLDGNLPGARRYLLNQLPKQRQEKESALFD